MRISDWSSDVCSSDLKAKAEKPVADYEPQVRTTKLSGTFGGQRINYAATIGETIIKNKDGVPEVAVVTTSYVKEPRDPSRPITFLFNGGPGSGTVWLMMGAFGPKRVAIPGNGTDDGARSEEHTSELQSLMRNSYAV